MTDAARIFERDRYVVVPLLLKQPSLSKFYRYVHRSASSVRMAEGDEQVAGTPCAYGDFMMDGLLSELQAEIENTCRLVLFPTYSYFRLYKHGDTLTRHTDRPACEISVSLCLGYEAPKAWPIWIEGPHGKSSVSLEAGDALLYRGTECVHWRDAFEGEHVAQVFLHYVDRHGPYADWKFDKRERFSKFADKGSLSRGAPEVQRPTRSNKNLLKSETRCDEKKVSLRGYQNACLV